ncbi:MAG: alpha-1,4-glucan--maltose-1-phosphate maltosyltransferase [Chitinispirillaceae bacterium]|nr:alpha-1,4-glucan--maltose-1-phosphate maltosyltransferase [Chitinispirillaceae bacterium]
MTVKDGRKRVVIEGISPEIDAGRFPVKRVVGDRVVVEADVFTDGHDAVSCMLLYRRETDTLWNEVPMEPLVNDLWRGAFHVREIGRYRYTIMAWVDHFRSWSRDLTKRIDAGQDLTVELQAGAMMIAAALSRAAGADAGRLGWFEKTLTGGSADAPRQALSVELASLMDRYADRSFAAKYDRELVVAVSRERARFSAWYELFPRSCSPDPKMHGTFKDVEARLPSIAAMGFDVLYLPPIHPIGRSFRKGPNNSTSAGPDDHGSPWAIGGPEGGHKSIHPQLGTLKDFRHLVHRVEEFGIELALDIAFQCSPDHPYATEHPEWFRRRPDGTIQYAENPPKKYQDIYPFDFETGNWRELWDELLSIVRFWAGQGVRIFRVDNPHTKPFALWEWLISEIQREFPETIFLAEAFTRPKVTYRLAKLGFTQSYNYFAWRNTKHELTEYFTELTQPRVSDFFGPNLWPNTPDILTEYLQCGGRPAFMVRLILAATLGPSYGIYGPAFELCDNTPLAPGKEEYLNSEKYEIRHWNLRRPDSLKTLIALVNRIRRENPAMRTNFNLQFHHVDNDQIIAYSKVSEDLANQVLVVVNLDPHHRQSGFVDLPLEQLRLDPFQPYQVHDLLTGDRYLWEGSRNYMELDPAVLPAHIFAIRRRVLTEQDFDYYL